jgi:hypothetical protein
VTAARGMSAATAAAGLVADVLRIALLVESGDHDAAEYAAASLPDVTAALMAAAAMIRTDAAVPLDVYAARALPAAERFLEGHGTIGGYERHRVRGEDPCAACRVARRTYDRAQYRARSRDRQEVAS